MISPPGHAREHVGGEEHQLAVGEDDLAVLGDDAEAVTVAIEGQADLGIGFLQRADHVLQVLGLRGVGVVVREISVDFAEQFDQFAAELFEQCRSDAAGNAVAAVHDDLHRAGELDVADDLRDVGFADVGCADGACMGVTSGEQIAGFDACLELLDGVKRQRLAADHHLQAVVVRRVVAAGDRDAAVATQLVGGEVGERRRYAADVDGIDASGHDPLHQRARKFRAGQAAVAADGDGRLLAFAGQRTERLTDGTADFRGEGFADDAADVVGLEDFGGELEGHVSSDVQRNGGGAAAASRVVPAGCQ